MEKRELVADAAVAFVGMKYRLRKLMVLGRVQNARGKAHEDDIRYFTAVAGTFVWKAASFFGLRLRWRYGHFGAQELFYDAGRMQKFLGRRHFYGGLYLT